MEPLVFARIDRDSARAINAAIGFQPLGPDAPIPFVLPSASADYERALDCLASAVWYEAGDDRGGQQAVAQVVLNRLRHPAYPHTVCGVVYQGAQRSTGCQFTFTCDGALARHPSIPGWQRARDTARAFLAGATDPRVGMATHYHTDWVHPYWSASLDKIAQVGTHLFFRWHGGWGRRAAFASGYAGGEQREPRLAMLSPAHAGGDTPRLAYALDGAAGFASPARAGGSGLVDRGSGDHFILVDAQGDGGALALQGLGQCRGASYCKVVGWDRRAQGFGSPDNPVARTVAFLYVSDRRTGVEVVLWDCGRYNRPVDSQCLSEANRRWISFQGDLSRAS
ncbi:cell wall hydrolase [Novosphingobium colocasiae]|uniref:cell wall hydrolase n=1 Tax=Novosphingobium colocasiae TaxID=1256513 RepID=UPI0035B3AB31